MRITSPVANAAFRITPDGNWPSILFWASENAVRWDWRIEWQTFSRAGTVVVASNEWDAKDAVTGLGGLLTVTANGTASISVELAGVNPSAQEILAYLSTRPGSAGFEKILQHETQMTHFDAKGQPKVSFDSGFGICQLTKPAPTYEQCWNWKRNIDAGLALYAAKRQAAARYLSQQGRAFTEDQLKRETVARWNGGGYHIWSAAKNAWVRNPGILCDSKTGNIGWDLTKPINRQQNEAALHLRDSAKYRRGPSPTDGWGYFGVCYADRLLGPPAY